MSAELEDIRRQLADLTARVERAEGLRAMMDRDQADLKQRLDSADLMLQALHVTQSNHTQRLTRIEDSLAAGLTRIEERVSLLEERSTRIEEGIRAIIATLDRLAPPDQSQS